MDKPIKDVTWRKRPKRNVNLILSELRKVRKYSNDGKMTLQAGLGWPWKEVLASALCFDERIDTRTVGICVHSLVFSKEARFDSAEKLLLDISKICEEELSRPKIPYRIYLEITSTPVLADRRVIGGCRCQIGLGSRSSRNQKMLSSRRRFVENNRRFPFGSANQAYCPVVVSVNERDHYRAAEAGFRDFAVVRALMNLVVNRQREFRYSNHYPPKPVNSILSGPLHTVHDVGGNLVEDDAFWYETEWMDPVAVADLSKELKFAEQINYLSARLTKNPLRAYASEALRRYVAALDNRSWHKAFSDLWSLLEYLTLSQKLNYDCLISRASGIYSNRESTSEILEHLRHYRNEIIHGSDIPNPHLSEKLMYECKDICEDLLWIVVRNKIGFAKEDEWRDFLDVTPNKSVFDHRNKIDRMVVKFRKW